MTIQAIRNGGAGDGPASEAGAGGVAVGVEGGRSDRGVVGTDRGQVRARWGIEEYFQLFKSVTRIGNQRLPETDPLLKCLAFDAATDFRVFSVEGYARCEHRTEVAEVLTEGGGGK